MQNKKFLVIGLGRFGSSLALTLKQQGCFVVGVDLSKSLVDEYSSKLHKTEGADTTNELSLLELEPLKYDVVVVAIGVNIQASVMTAVLLKDMNVKHIVCKAISESHGKMLEKIGVNQVVYPERDSGKRLGQQLVSPNLLELIELSTNYRVAEISIPAKLDGITIAKINPNGKYPINIVAVNRSKNEDELIIAPKADVALRAADRIVVIGKTGDLDKFEREVVDK